MNSFILFRQIHWCCLWSASGRAGAWVAGGLWGGLRGRLGLGSMQSWSWTFLSAVGPQRWSFSGYLAMSLEWQLVDVWVWVCISVGGVWMCVYFCISVCIYVRVGGSVFLFSLLFLPSGSHFVLLNAMKHSMQIKLNWLINFIKR